MHYFYLEDRDLPPGKRVLLAEKDLDHAYRVLRLRPGDTVVVSDGRGLARRGQIAAASSREVAVELKEALPAVESPLSIVLCQGLLKGDKFDLVLRQAVELGVTRIIPLTTLRCVARPGRDQGRGRIRRWRMIARSAAAQCRRAVLPEVEEICTLEHLVPELTGHNALVPWEEEQSRFIDDYAGPPPVPGSSLYIFVGPEGGFAPEEVAGLNRAGAETVHLGPRVLRSETAAITVLALAQAAWGDLRAGGVR